MLKKTLLLLSLFALSTISYTEDTEDPSHKKPLSNPILGGWTTYDQHLGTLNDEFFTIGGVSVGISFLGIAVGLAFYGSYPYELKKTSLINNDFQLYYGGLVLGYKSVWRNFGFRLFTIIGLGSTETWYTYRLHFVLSPSIHFDWHVYRSFVISVGMSYRYMSGLPNARYDINYWKNALHGTLSFGWVH